MVRHKHNHSKSFVYLYIREYNQSIRASAIYMRYIAIEGCMGAGKSTLVDMLQRSRETEAFGVRSVLQEPVKDWGPLLAEFYENPQRNALVLQLEILRSRVQQLLDAEVDFGLSGDDIILVERSIESSSDVFVPMMSKNVDDTGDVLMSPRDVFAYKKWQTTMEGIMHEKHHELAGIIFIDAEPETCLNRIKSRARDGEAKISLGYLEHLRDQYHAWLGAMQEKGITVTVVRSHDGEEGMQRLHDDTVDSLVRMI